MGFYSPTLQQRKCDVECAKDYFLVKFYDGNGNFTDFEIYPGKVCDAMALRMMLALYEIVTFNGNHYDIPMIAGCLSLLTKQAAHGDKAGAYICQELKAYNDAIIVGRMKSWEFYKAYNIPELDIRHIDLFEVAPGVRIGLKMYMARMHSRTIQDLPFDPAASISPPMRVETSLYCGNDLKGTHELATHPKMINRLADRAAIGAQYGIDVMSKSDAQISEAVVKAQLSFKAYKTKVPHGHQFFYQAPDFIRFTSSLLQEALRIILTTPFTVNDVDQLGVAQGEEVFDLDGVKIKTGIILPEVIKGLDITIGSSTYTMGIGGLHSTESRVWYRSVAGVNQLSDHDVASYYPSLILLMEMFPEAIGPEFMAIYRQVYDDRLHAKRMIATCKASGDKEGAKVWKSRSDGLKIVLNGAFGKLGSKYSILFAPELLIRTTITGQLALLMLIECMEANGIPVVSANTDGIIVNTPAHLYDQRDLILKWWEQATGLETEETPYVAIFNRDVNNYIAFKPDGTHKAKGVYGEAGLSPDASPTGKHPDQEICADACIEYLARGTPLYTTIRACQDIRKFVSVQQVAGGAVWEKTGEYLGKVARWYMGIDSPYCLRSAKLKPGQVRGNQVGGSLGAVPCMVLPDVLPGDLDYGYYERAAYSMLLDLGVIK